MGSGEEWANDGNGGRCSLALAGIVSAVLLTAYGAVVLITDAVKLLV